MKTAFKWLIAVVTLVFCIVIFIIIMKVTKTSSNENLPESTDERISIQSKYYEKGDIYTYHLSFEKKDETQVIETYNHHFHQNAGEYISCFNWKTGNSLWMENQYSQEVLMGKTTQIKRICDHKEPHRIYIWSQEDNCNHEKH